jgi:hypothetical protein
MPAPIYRIHSLGESIGHGAAQTRRLTLSAIAKYNGGRGAAYCIANEYICGELARFLRLPVPPVAMAAPPSGEPCVVSLDFNPAGQPLAPADVNGCLHQFPLLSAGVLLFDIWIANPDRHNGNFHLDLGASPPALHIFDHCQALLGHVHGEALLRMARLRDDLGTKSCFLARMTADSHFPLWLDRIRATPDFFIEEICHDSRPFGLTDAECTAAIDFLKTRRDSLPALINSHRAAFKRIATWTLSE